MSHPDAHQAYIAGSVAAFIFDGRSSRRYADPGGRIISEQQLADFDTFCLRIARDRGVRFVVMGCAVPFLNLKDFVEELGSQAPKGAHRSRWPAFATTSATAGTPRVIGEAAQGTDRDPAQAASSPAGHRYRQCQRRHSCRERILVPASRLYQGTLPVHELGADQP